MTRKRVAFDLAIIAVLCFLAYLPALSVPLIEDDYPNIAYAVQHVPRGGLALLADPIFRVRATSTWLMYGIWSAFGLAPIAFHAVSLSLHVVNCWLLYAIGKNRLLPALVASAFFAVHEGHQEAVMWFSACNELLMFLFGASALLFWLLASRGIIWELASIAAFALALLSKESAIVWLPLFMLVAPRRWRSILPHAGLAALTIALIWSTRSYSFRFSDGSFSWSAPFWLTWTRSFLRLLWPWGWLALAALAWQRDRKLWRSAAAALVWMGIALAPYSFLTYSTQIPSRQTYLASAGLAFLLALAVVRLQPRRLVIAALVVVLIANLAYLWTRKRAQFLERAAPTEQLIRFARETSRPVWVQCFPRNRLIAEEAVHMGAGRAAGSVVWDEANAIRRGAAPFCYRGR